MVRRAVIPGILAMALAFGIGYAFGGVGAAVSAGIGMICAFGNFAGLGLSIAWASEKSINMVHAVAFIAPIALIAVIVGLLALLQTLSWFFVVAFAWAIMPGTMVLLGLAARMMLRGVGTQLEVPADPVAQRAADQLATQEAH